jgi:hypothetical protein
MAIPIPPTPFPLSIDAIPVSERISENFGWVPGGLGVLAVVTFLTSFVRPELWDRLLAGIDRHAPSASSVSVGLRIALISIGGLLIWWEFRRRSRRTVLVPRNGFVGIYRDGQFVEGIPPTRMTLFRLNRGVTFMMAMMPLAGFGLIFGSLSGTDAPEPLMTLSGTALLIGNSSSLFTRTRFAHWRVPTKDRGGDEQVMLKKAEVGRLFNPSASTTNDR